MPRNIDTKVRKSLLKAFYGSNTWTLGGTEENRLLEFETWYYRRMLRISWIEHITNEEVCRRSGETRSFLNTLKPRRAK